jgi:hypothetical protein
MRKFEALGACWPFFFCFFHYFFCSLPVLCVLCVVCVSCVCVRAGLLQADAPCCEWESRPRQVRA